LEDFLSWNAAKILIPSDFFVVLAKRRAGKKERKNILSKKILKNRKKWWKFTEICAIIVKESFLFRWLKVVKTGKAKNPIEQETGKC
jgi:hypothetical protein